MKRVWNCIAVILLACVLCLFVSATEANVVTGACGDNATYTIDTETGTLTISGSGAMYDYVEDFAPWSDLLEGTVKIYSVVIEEGITVLGQNMLMANGYVESISIPASVTSISESAFPMTAALKTIAVDAANTAYAAVDNVLYDKEIKTLLYYPLGKTDTAYAIPDTVQSIAQEAFMNSYLTALTIPASVTSISSVFQGSALESITVDAANTAYCSVDGVLLDKDMTKILCYPAKKTGTTYTIPASVTEICTSAFGSNAYLTSIEIPSTVQTVGAVAFSGATALEQATVYTETLEIEYTFMQCPALTDLTVYSKNVTVNDSLGSADMYSFDDCSADLVITCYKGSGLDTYAAEKGIAVEYIVVEDILGDIDGDGELTVADVLTSLRAVLAGDLENAPDMNGDGKVSLLDILRMLKKMVA